MNKQKNKNYGRINVSISSENEEDIKKYVEKYPNETFSSIVDKCLYMSLWHIPEFMEIEDQIEEEKKKKLKELTTKTEVEKG